MVPHKIGSLIAALFVASSVGLFPATAGSAAGPTFVVRLTISGGYQFSGTLVATSSQWEGYSCDAFQKVHQYRADYNLDAIARAQQGDLGKDAFQIVLFDYASGHYTYKKNILLFVLVRQHAFQSYVSGASLSGARTRVKLSPDLHSGTFRASHVTRLHGQGAPVSIRGSWYCQRLFR
jgi:hypothetical protein